MAQMTAPLSLDIRRRLVAAIEGGSSCHQAAARFAVSPSAAIKLMQRVRRTGSIVPGRVGGCRKPELTGHKDWLHQLTRTRVGITLEEIKAVLIEERGIEVSITAIWRMLRKLGLSHKKSRSRRPSVSAPTSPRTAPAGMSGSASWTRPPSSSSTRRAPRPT